MPSVAFVHPSSITVNILLKVIFCRNWVLVLDPEQDNYYSFTAKTLQFVAHSACLRLKTSIFINISYVSET